MCCALAGSFFTTSATQKAPWELHICHHFRIKDIFFTFFLIYFLLVRRKGWNFANVWKFNLDLWMLHSSNKTNKLFGEMNISSNSFHLLVEKYKFEEHFFLNLLEGRKFLQQHSSVQFSCSVMSNSLQPHEPQHARPPCPSPTPGVHPNSCPLSRWCHPTI